ncbi:alpha/beta hydrolase [Nocardia sp. NBC_00565]|uniref:alpha/beta hydrolase n=1 Tax=Nocardia sp. NBC_00565 TaxID=2975993 RepID=UPI002E8028D5|nr:alpha/beta hydrolase [Nocardia sp. NBC_00565]WUC00830.1 alpha/beta hydrolase [Nocardia sp. NBC_00565]
MGKSEAADRAETFVPHEFAEYTVDLGEIRMNYVVEGDPCAPALLLIPAQGESWWGYEKAIPLLMPHFQVFAVDLRGQGRSTWTPGRYTLDNVGNDLVRFIDRVIGRPTLAAGNSSGGVIAAWLAAFAKPGQIRAAVLEDPPLFSAQAAPPYGPGMMQTLGPMFAAWAKWLGDQWEIGDWDGLVQALPHELPAPLLPGIGFMLGDGTSDGAAAKPPQHLKEYDPEWARSWATDLANTACDHQSMLAQVRVPILLTHHFRMTDPETGHLIGALTDLQAQQVCRILEATGRPVTYVSLPDAPHTMHDPDPKRYVETVIDWIATLD